MSEFDTGTESGATSESTASSESASPAQTQEAGSQQEAASQTPKESPFHEHPRFKELVEQKNASQQEFQRLQQDYRLMQAQMAQFQQQQNQYQKQNQPKPPSYDELLRELEQVNPAFAKAQREVLERLPKVDEVTQTVNELREQMAEDRRQRDAVTARSSFDKLCSDNKISDNDKFLYEEAVANLANIRGSKVSELPALFTEVHNKYSKYFEGRDRSLRESYVSQKKADKAPATQTGGTAVGLPGNKGPNSQAEVKAAFAAALRARSTGN